MKYQITNQRALRRAFWEANPQASKRRVISHRTSYGNICEYVTDTRVAWCDWIDMLSKDGTISQELAQRATLD